MRICQFNTFPRGGAATAARRLHDSLRGDGVDSHFFYWKNDDQKLDNSYHQLEFQESVDSPLLAPLIRQHKKFRQRKIKRRYDRHIRPRSKDFEVFSGAHQLEMTRFDWAALGGDIAHLHWVAFFIDYASFFASIPDEVPLVWTLHDMNPFTGGCHYSSGCSRFTVGCGNCPQLVKPHAMDESGESFKVKKRALRRKNLTIVTPSEWMAQLAQSSPIFGEHTNYEIIRYGFDLETYRPINPYDARQQLGLPDEDTIYIGFGAEDINHHRKGFALLIEALRKMNCRKQVECIVFGGGKLPEDLTDLPKIHSVGFIDSPQKQAVVYSAMDFFVMPSLEDNSPQTGLEAFACGTPVIGFKTGGVPEFVRPQETGLLCSVGDVDQLAASMSRLVDNPILLQRMSRKARQLMEDRYSLHEQSYNYQMLYQKLTGEYQEPLVNADWQLRRAA